MALFEFAPGNLVYANGHKLKSIRAFFEGRNRTSAEGSDGSLESSGREKSYCFCGKCGFASEDRDLFPSPVPSRPQEADGSRLMQTILMLEDMQARIDAFRHAIAQLPGVQLLIWSNAAEMIRDLPQHLPTASLISLDHDLLPPKGSHVDPGSGLDVCEFLAKQEPRCPVLLHTSNYIKVWSMMNALNYAKWDVHRSPPVGMGEDWIESVWLPRLKELLAVSGEAI